MDLGSACQGGQRETSPHDTWTLISQPFDLVLLERGRVAIQIGMLRALPGLTGRVRDQLNADSFR